MQLDHLKALLLTIELGSISSAARQLNKKQPQVSQWVSDLEIDLGIAFFQRSGNKTFLTEQGKELLPNLKILVHQMEKLQQNANALRQEELTQLVIGIESYIPDELFQDVIAGLTEHFTGNLTLYRAEAETLLLDLSKKHCDIAFMHHSEPLTTQSTFSKCALSQYREVLVVGETHPLREISQVSDSDLVCFRELVWGTTDDEGEFGLSDQYALFDDITLLSHLLAQGFGYAFLPELKLHSLPNASQLATLNYSSEPHLIRNVDLCWRQGLQLHSQGKGLIQRIREYYS